MVGRLQSAGYFADAGAGNTSLAIAKLARRVKLHGGWPVSVYYLPYLSNIQSPHDVAARPAMLRV